MQIIICNTALDITDSHHQHKWLTVWHEANVYLASTAISKFIPHPPACQTHIM